MSTGLQAACELAFKLAGASLGVAPNIRAFKAAAGYALGDFTGPILCDPNNYGPPFQGPPYNPSDDLPGLPPGMFDDPPPPSDPPPPDPGGAGDGYMGDAGDALLPPGGLLSPLVLDLDGDGVELTALSKTNPRFDMK